MEYIDSFIKFSNDYFRPLLILITSSFAIYFAIKKLGNSVSVQYSIKHERFSAPRIDEVVLSNNKDKAVSIYSIYAVFNKDLLLELKRFSPPEILKPNETIGIFTGEYSSLSIDGDEISLKLEEAEIFLESKHKNIKCTSIVHENLLQRYRHITKHTCIFNGFVYDETVAYIMSYVINNENKTAFIHFSGYIGNEWEFSYNHLGEEPSVRVILNFINEGGLEDIFTNYQIFEVLIPSKQVKFVAKKHNKSNQLTK